MPGSVQHAAFQGRKRQSLSGPELPMTKSTFRSIFQDRLMANRAHQSTSCPVLCLATSISASHRYARIMCEAEFRSEIYIPIYFPRSIDGEQGTPIDLLPGIVFGNVDISVAPVRTYHVRGRIPI